MEFFADSQTATAQHPCVAEAQALGLPATLFGFTPDQGAYWREPGLPWLTRNMLNHSEQMPLDYRGYRAILCIGYTSGDSMAPRFPKGCGVQTSPVWDKANLVVGRVYAYSYQNQTTGAREWELGRLVTIGGNYLEVKADNNPTPSIWLLRDEPDQAVWDVREVTHYASYPAEQEGYEYAVAIDGAALLAQRPALQQLLLGLPMLAFSEKGRANLCQRFDLTDTELTAALAAFEATHPTT